MTSRVQWRPTARADLIALYDWIRQAAGADIAFSYASGVEARTAALVSFPSSGAPRDDLAPGVRTVVYRRRTMIAYRVVGHDIEILALAHAGRDLGHAFAEHDDR